jgi:hypothetical protein
MSVSVTDPVIILCLKWGTAYGPEYVNRLHRGVSRHLRRPFRFVCMTDDGSQLHEGIEIYPLPQFNLPSWEKDLVWRKLALFNDPLFDLKGTALFLDLDVVIVGSLDELFERPGPFHIIRDDHLALPKWGRWLNPARAIRLRRVGNSSVMRFEIGAHAYIPAKYLADPQKAMAEQPNHREQELVTEEVNDRGLLQHWPKGWCVSFKNQCVPLFVSSYLRNPEPPPGAKIVVFAGKLKIPDAIAGKGGSWYRHIGPSPWLEAAWSD